MRIGKKTLDGHQLGDLTVLVVLAGFVVWYFADAYKASSHVLNLILVLPVSLIVLTLCLVEFVRQILLGKSEHDTASLEPVSSVVPIVSLFTVYVLSLRWLGFDVGTALFVSASLWLHGERRPHWILGYAICFALLVSLLFSRMLPYPMPMLVLPSGF
jgi:putative tricarboxylic transport membrane protein